MTTDILDYIIIGIFVFIVSWYVWMSMPDAYEYIHIKVRSWINKWRKK